MIEITTTQVFLLVLTVLFLIVLTYFIGKKMGEYLQRRELDEIIRSERKDAIKRSKAVMKGQISEEITPFSKDFPYNPSELKFLGKPIDFIVFKGMDDKEIDEVVFLEIKTGSSRLNKQEKKLKETIMKKNVRWEEYRL